MSQNNDKKRTNSSPNMDALNQLQQDMQEARQRFDEEMKKMEEEMIKVRSQIENK